MIQDIQDPTLRRQVKALTGRELEELPPKKFDELNTALRDCEGLGVSMGVIIDDLRARGFPNPDFHQVSITARRAFIEEQLGVGMDSQIALRLSERSVPVLRERMNRIDQLNVVGALLIGYRDLTREDREKGIRIELVRPDILVPKTETIEANLDVYRREGIVYYGEGVPLNRSDGLVVSTKRLEANLAYLKGKLRLDIKDAGDLLGESPETLEAAVLAIAKSHDTLSVATLRTYAGRVQKKEK